MVIVTSKHLDTAAAKYKNAAKELAAWEAIIGQVQWQSFNQLRETLPDADSVDGYVTFNIRHNRYRLVTVIHYAKDLTDRRIQGHCYIRSFLTHSGYTKSNWDKEYGK